MKRRYSIVWLFLCGWILFPFQSWCDTLTIDKPMSRVFLRKHLEYIDFGTNSTNPDDYTLDLLSGATITEVPQSTDQVFSYKFSLKNTTGKHLSYYLRPYVFGYNKIFVIPEVGDIQVFKGGEALRFSERSVPTGNYQVLFPIEIPTNRVVTIYMIGFNHMKGFADHFKKYPPRRSLPYLTDKDKYIVDHQEHRYIEFSMMAAMVALVLYNLIVFFKTKYKSYIFYVLNVISFVLYYLFQSQIGFELFWGDFPWFHYKGGLYPAALAIWFGIIFFQSYTRSRELIPKFHKILSVIGYSCISIIIVMVVYQITRIDAIGDLAVEMVRIIAFSAMITLLVSCIIAIIKGSVEARFYLFTTLVLILCIGLFFIIGSSSNFGKSLILIGYTSQSLLLSFGLAGSINALQAEIGKQKLAQVKLREDQAKEKQLMLEGQKEILEAEVKKQTAELRETNDELFSTVDQLNFANEKMAAQRKNLESVYRKVTSSIQYAKRIQQASLPTDDSIDKILPESFILYMPRDIVSGDFYWCGEQDGKTIVIASDSTGHGVPGAFMSLIGIKLLDQIIYSQGITSPKEILRHLDIGVAESLHIDSSNVHRMNDGMDIAIVTIDPAKKELTFSGAHNPMLVIHQEGQSFFKGDRLPIGNLQRYREKNFHNQQYHYSEGDTFYLYSDGFPDQFGGPEERKYYHKPFRAFLEKLAHHPISKQQALLEKEFNDWKGTGSQLDDLLVIGVKL